MPLSPPTSWFSVTLFCSLTSAVTATALILTEGKCAEVVLDMTVKTRNHHAHVSPKATRDPFNTFHFSRTENIISCCIHFVPESFDKL